MIRYIVNATVVFRVVNEVVGLRPLRDEPFGICRRDGPIFCPLETITDQCLDLPKSRMASNAVARRAGSAPVAAMAGRASPNPSRLCKQAGMYTDGSNDVGIGGRHDDGHRSTCGSPPHNPPGIRSIGFTNRNLSSQPVTPAHPRTRLMSWLKQFQHLSAFAVAGCSG